MELKQINEALKVAFNRSSKNRLDRKENSETDEIHEYYACGMDGFMLQIELKENSYTENEEIIGIQFVKPVIKEVTFFEPI